MPFPVGGLIHFTEAAAAAPQVVNSLVATGAGANIGVALRPKGTGALTAQVPDGAAAGGNARGDNAVDWQMWRAVNTQVASGSDSVIAGGSINIASAAESTVGGGSENSATAIYATVAGGGKNTASNEDCAIGGGFENIANGVAATVAGGMTCNAAADYSSIGGGRNNTANAFYATVSGGQSNLASGEYSIVAGGWGNQATGSLATISGGDDNVASAEDSTIGGGYANNVSAFATTVGGGMLNYASAEYASVVGGVRASAYLHGMEAYSASMFSVIGDAQRSDLVARRETTNATQSELFLNGSTLRAVLPAGKSWRATINIVARQTAGTAGTVGDTYVTQAIAAIKRIGAVTSLVGAVVYNDQINDAAAAGWTVLVDADAPNNALRIQVTGELNKTIRWVAHIALVEVA